MTDAPLAWDATTGEHSGLPIRVLRAPRWRTDDARGLIALHMDKTGGTSWMHPRVRPILEALADGTTQSALVDAARVAEPTRSDASLARSVRALLAGLAEQGNVRVDIPSVPPVLDGRFRVRRELGRGGVGIAWLCDDAETGERVVVKHAWNWSGPLAERDARIRAEGDALALLDHAGVARLFARFDVDGRHHLARSFVDGEDLARIVARDGPGEHASLVLQVADVLRHMHARGILCLDLAPSNFLLTDERRLVLADVGHARRVGDPVRGKRWGTPGFTAPDLPAAFGTTADVYGLGALGVFLATGKPYDPGRPESLDGIPRERFFRACLAPAPARPATVERALEAWS